MHKYGKKPFNADGINEEWPMCLWDDNIGIKIQKIKTESTTLIIHNFERRVVC